MTVDFRAIALLTLVVGCGNDPPSTVTLHTGDAPLIAADVGDGWTVLPPRSDVALAVDGPFVVATVCEREEMTQVTVDLRAPEDGDFVLPCQVIEDPVPLTVTITSEPLISANVFAGGSSELFPRSVSNQTMRVARGTTDLLAIEDDVAQRFVLVRDLELDGPTEIGIDIAADGRALVPRELLVSGLAAEEMTQGYLMMDVRIEMAGVVGATLLAFDAGIIPGLPTDVLRPEDRHVAHVLYGAMYPRFDRRWYEAPLGDAAFDAMIPAPLTAFTPGVDPLRVTFEDDRDWAVRTFYADGLTPGLTWRVVASPSWTTDDGARNALTMPDVETIPGWDPAWALVWSDSVLIVLELESDHAEAARSGLQRGEIVDVSSP